MISCYYYVARKSQYSAHKGLKILHNRFGTISDISSLLSQVQELLTIFNMEGAWQEGAEPDDIMSTDGPNTSSYFIKLISSGVRELVYRRTRSLFDLLLFFELFEQSSVADIVSVVHVHVYCLC